MSDDDFSAAKTHLYSGMTWIAPAASFSELPESAEDGSYCYVQDEERIYQFVDGTWTADPKSQK